MRIVAYHTIRNTPTVWYYLTKRNTTTFELYYHSMTYETADTDHEDDRSWNSSSNLQEAAKSATKTTTTNENEEDEIVSLNAGDAEDATVEEKKDPTKLSTTSLSSSSLSIPQHSPYVWLHAFYHSIVTIIGTGLLGFSYATSFLGWTGTTVFITGISAYCYYTARLLIDLQDHTQSTYSAVADAIMGPGFSNYTVRPAQYVNFFLTTATMILIGGGAFAELDVLAQQGGTADPVLSKHVWMVLDALVVLLLSLLPDLNRAWQISVLGAVAAFIMVIYSIAGSIVGIVDNTDAALLGTATVTYVQPDSVTTTLEYNFSIMASFGSILFGYGFHQVLPDIQTSLQDHSTHDAKADMRKAVTTAFACSYPAYLTVALVGFAAFGIGVSSELMESIQTVIPSAAMYPIWIVVIIKTSTEAAVFNQAAFTLMRDICGLTTPSDDTDPTSDPPPRKTKIFDVLMKVIYISCATLVALFLPY